MKAIVKVGKASSSSDLRRASFSVLMYSKDYDAVYLLSLWVQDLDDSSWVELQIVNILRDLGELRSLAQSEMYKVLEESKDEVIKKRALAILDALRQIA